MKSMLLDFYELLYSSSIYRTQDMIEDRDRQLDRQTDRLTDRQTDRQTNT
jgi:hypothetical protein